MVPMARLHCPFIQYHPNAWTRSKALTFGLACLCGSENFTRVLVRRAGQRSRTPPTSSPASAATRFSSAGPQPTLTERPRVQERRSLRETAPIASRAAGRAPSLPTRGSVHLSQWSQRRWHRWLRALAESSDAGRRDQRRQAPATRTRWGRCPWVYRWWIADDGRRRARILTAHKLTCAHAALAFPGAEPDLQTREMRELPELSRDPWNTRPGEPWVDSIPADPWVDTKPSR